MKAILNYFFSGKWKIYISGYFIRMTQFIKITHLHLKKVLIMRGPGILFSFPILGLFNLQSLINQNTFKYAAVIRQNPVHMPGPFQEACDLEQFVFSLWPLNLSTDKPRWKSLSPVFLCVLKAGMPAIYETQSLTHSISSMRIDTSQADVAIQGSEFLGVVFMLGQFELWLWWNRLWWAGRRARAV